jgi:hypothetical protein
MKIDTNTVQPPWPPENAADNHKQRGDVSKWKELADRLEERKAMQAVGLPVTSADAFVQDVVAHIPGVSVSEVLTVLQLSGESQEIVNAMKRLLEMNRGMKAYKTTVKQVPGQNLDITG